MGDHSQIQKSEPAYSYEFKVDQLDVMSVCLDAHGFAIIKDVLPDWLIDSLKQAVLDGTDPERGLKPGKVVLVTPGLNPARVLGNPWNMNRSCASTGIFWAPIS